MLIVKLYRELKPVNTRKKARKAFVMGEKNLWKVDYEKEIIGKIKTKA